MAGVLTPQELAKHVTIWNRRERRKIAGNAAPLRRNLSRYLNAHPECEEYNGQDKHPTQPFCDEIDPITGESISVQNEHVPIWHRIERRKVTGNAAPLRKNLVSYLKKNPNCEVYDGQDKQRAASPNWHYSLSNPNSSVDAHGRVCCPTARPSTTTAAAYQMHHQTHQPVNAPAPPAAASASATNINNNNNNNANANANANANSSSKHSPCAAESDAHAPPHRSQPMPMPQPIAVHDLPYHEMASSWSNNPEWISHITSLYAPPSAFGAAPPPAAAAAAAAHMCHSPMDTSADHHPDAIPIPGRHPAALPLDRDPVLPPPPLAPDAAAMDYASAFLCVTPRSIDLEHDALQFSPSSYLLSSLSLPKGSPTLPACQPPTNPSILGE